MSLIECKVCNHLVSKLAKKCPKCGVDDPMSEHKHNMKIAKFRYELELKIKEKEKYEKEHKKEIENFKNTPISCPECNEKRPLKCYLLTEREYFQKITGEEEKYRCLNCGYLIYIKCDLCVYEMKRGVVGYAAVIYRHFNNRGYKLCHSHRNIETLEQLDLIIHPYRYCEICGRKLSLFDRFMCAITFGAFSACPIFHGD
jgi:hypothetical protein